MEAFLFDSRILVMLLKPTPNKKEWILESSSLIKKLSASVTGDDEYQLIAIYTGDVWFLCTVTEETIKSFKFERFCSVTEFVEFYKKKGL